MKSISVDHQTTKRYSVKPADSINKDNHMNEQDLLPKIDELESGENENHKQVSDTTTNQDQKITETKTSPSAQVLQVAEIGLIMISGKSKIVITTLLVSEHPLLSTAVNVIL